jgi:hypothetical protein
MNCPRNDVVLLPIPFTDLTRRKVRPAIIIGRSGADLFLVLISSVLANSDFSLHQRGDFHRTKIDRWFCFN